MKGLLKEEIKGKIFYGEILDAEDPDKDGRCKVMVYGVFDSVEVADLPWATPANSHIFAGGESGGSGNISIPKKGSIVRVHFIEGDIYSPEWIGLAYINDTLKTEISESYIGSHVLVRDEDADLKIYYTPKNGFEIWFAGSKFAINPDKSVTIEHEGTQSIIELQGVDCNISTQGTVNITAPNKIEEVSSKLVLNGKSLTQLGPTGNMSAVGAEPLFAFLKAMATALDVKWPATPGVNAALASAAEQAATSKIVKVTVP
jgi:hypothetical protein